MKIRFSVLLVSLIAMLLAAPALIASPLGSQFLPSLFWLTLVTAAFAVADRRAVRWTAIVLGLPAVLLDFAVVHLGASGLAVEARVVEIAFLGFVCGVVLYRVFTEYRVDLEVILGGICVYLLLGMFFFNCYTLLEMLEPSSFVLGGEPVTATIAGVSGRFLGLLYFSFVTMTTLGYGDITPTTPTAQMLSAFQAMVGQIYLTVLVAVLVGIHVSQRIAERVAATPR